MIPRHRLLPVVATLSLLTIGSLCAAQVATPLATTQPADDAQQRASRFMRFVDNGATGGRLETQDVVYRNDEGVTVRLVSVVHIGERTYYEALDRSFAAYDAVLYELVKPKDAAVPAPGAQSNSSVSQFQRFLKDVLNLEFQLDLIDYSRPNFVHADLDAETFQRMQAERGESMMTLMMRAMMDAMSKPQPAAQTPDQMLNDLISVLTRPDAERQMKLMLARQMSDIERVTAGLEGPNGSVILTERNKAAIKVLKDTLAQGKKDVAIFYGAAHMPDLEKRLLEMGFKPVASEWRLAWDVSIRHDRPSAIEQLLRDAVRALEEEEW